MAKAAASRLNWPARAMGISGPRALWVALGVLLAALLAAVAAALLPDNPYQRWQLLDATIHNRARWIYERIHYDPQPLDVVLIGPSRMGAGVSAPQLAAALGLPAARVANFAMPENGRNMHALIVNELFTAKRPKLLVVGVIEKPGRYGHSAYRYIAPAADLANPFYLANIKWAGDLAYLPYRQLKLAAAQVASGMVGLATQFDPSAYRGSSLDTSGSAFLPEDRRWPGGITPIEELERGAAKLKAGNRPPILPASMADIEFGDERAHLRRIIAAARAHGTRIVFLSLPYYTGPATVQEQAFYERAGPVLNAGFLANDPLLFADYGHLNDAGAAKLSQWLGGQLRPLLEPTP
jgi:hypothetical protein